MTDVELLPLPAPDYLLPLGPGRGAISMWSENTIRQIVAHATAAQAAEIEALRAEVERLRADRDSWEQQASDRVADWHAEHLRAERMAEALEQCITSMLDSGYRADAVVIRAARAALAAYRKQGVSDE